MTQFGLFDAKNRFSELVGRALAGEDIVITKHGRPVARIVPYSDASDTDERARAHGESLARLASLRARAPRRMGIDEIVASRRIASDR